MPGVWTNFSCWDLATPKTPLAIGLSHGVFEWWTHFRLAKSPNRSLHGFGVGCNALEAPEVGDVALTEGHADDVVLTQMRSGRISAASITHGKDASVGGWVHPIAQNSKPEKKEKQNMSWGYGT